MTPPDPHPEHDRCDAEASAVVTAPPGEVFDFLSELENHWRIAGRFLEVVSVDDATDGPAGGTMRMRGPLGMRRTARTTVTMVREPSLIIGVAELPGGTRASVRWTLAESRSGATRVKLAAQVEHATRPDRALLALGGRVWLRRRFRDTLRELSCAFGEAPAPVATAIPQTTLGT